MDLSLLVRIICTISWFLNVADCLIDSSSESDLELTGSISEVDTAKVQTATVELDSDQIALYRGNREYQTITVEHYSIGTQSILWLLCLSTLLDVFLVNVVAFRCYCVSKWVTSVPSIAVRKVATPLWERICHVGSHSVTCHPAEVTFPPLPQPKLVLVNSCTHWHEPVDDMTWSQLNVDVLVHYSSVHSSSERLWIILTIHCLICYHHLGRLLL